MTAAIQSRPTTGRRSVNRETVLLVEAAKRGDIQVRRETRWDVYLLNGRECPDVRPLLVALLRDGVLLVVDPSADLSLIVPGGAR
ncbi:hypothetical protein ACQP2Y_21320 [Actinoplanes sp. CA-051413]|uniref:hypothetical protein n=1 Tax=Actinoplanes sp. CA-051413 TaxID=3239899 RepID=UPI003D983CDA